MTEIYVCYGSVIEFGVELVEGVWSSADDGDGAIGSAEVAGE